MKTKILKKYILCGLTGWCMEVFWTGLGSAINGDKKLTGTTSLWMFPIYATAIIIEPLGKMLIKHKWNFLFRGTIYALCIFVTEFISGSILKKAGACPWCYSDSKCNINQVIRLDYFPVWFIAGLIYEKLLLSKTS